MLLEAVDPSYEVGKVHRKPWIIVQLAGEKFSVHQAARHVTSELKRSTVLTGRPCHWRPLAV